MKYLDSYILDKIDKIEKSQSLASLETENLPPVSREEYYFISYSHADYKKVYADIYRLQNEGVNVWYDRGLPPGRDWEEIAQEFICKYACKGVIFYLSENSLVSPAVAKEIEFVKSKGKDYLSINIPLSFDEENKAKSATSMLKDLEKWVKTDEKSKRIINDAFGDKILFIDYNAEPDFKAEKIKLLNREPLFEIENFTDINDQPYHNIVSINNMEIKSITLPFVADFIPEKSRQFIGECAFANCKQLEKVILKSIYLDFPARSFFGCSNLKEIVGNEMGKVGNFAFAGCKNLEKIIGFFEGVGEYAFYGCENLKTLSISTFTNKIEPTAFYRSGIEKITLNQHKEEYKIASGVLLRAITKIKYQAKNELFPKRGKLEVKTNPKKIKYEVLHCFEGVEKVDLSNLNVVKILPHAFGYRKALKEVIIGDKVSEVCENAFEFCENLQKVTFVPSKNKHKVKIEKNTFIGCKNLSNVNLNGVTHLEADVFRNCDSLQVLEIPASLKTIDKNPFSDCNGIKEIKFNNKPKKLDQVFTFLPSVEKVTVPKTVKVINDFNGCENLKEIEFLKGSKVRKISDATSTYSLKKIAIPASVRKLSGFNDSSLETVTFQKGSKLRILGKDEGAFNRCNLKTIQIPAGVKYISGFNYCSKLQEVVFKNLNRLSVIEDSFSNCDSLKEITIPRLVASIDGFNNCYSLQNVRFNKLSCIREISGFKNSAITDLELPAVVKEINGFEGALIKNLCIPASVCDLKGFNGCKQLEKIEFKPSLAPLNLINGFSNCDSLKEVVIPTRAEMVKGFDNCESLEKITFKNGPFALSVYTAFSGCKNLKSIKITSRISHIRGFTDCEGLKEVIWEKPKGRQYVSSFAFLNCPSLKRINFTGTKSDWLKIAQSNKMKEPLHERFEIHCKDGIIGGK